VRGTLRGKYKSPDERSGQYEKILSLVQDHFKFCKGNVVRIQEILHDKYGHCVPYSSLTRIVRDLGLRDDKKAKRAGEYQFGPGEEAQHDTSPHRVVIGGKPITAQCAGFVLAYCKILFVQYYPAFTRFEAKVFLSEAINYMDGTPRRCIIDNTSVIVAKGSGPDAVIAPEMEAFGRIYGMHFVPHHIGDADRKAIMERNFAYAENNFLAGRTFTDWHDLNQQARNWCDNIANPKLKRSLGMSPQAAYLMEKPHLIPLPPHVPQVYKTLQRIIDVSGYVTIDTNRYSVPERLCTKKVEVYKSWDRIKVYFKQQKVADHKRTIDKRDAKIIAPGHHLPLKRKTKRGPSKEENALCGHYDVVDQYVQQIKKRSYGSGIRKLQKLLTLKRTYPVEPFNKAVEKALHYGLYDLMRLENMILSFIAGDFFKITEDNDE